MPKTNSNTEIVIKNEDEDFCDGITTVEISTHENATSRSWPISILEGLQPSKKHNHEEKRPELVNGSRNSEKTSNNNEKGRKRGKGSSRRWNERRFGNKFSGDKFHKKR